MVKRFNNFSVPIHNLLGLLYTRITNSGFAYIFILIFVFGASQKAFSQNETEEFEEISVFLLIQGIGGYEMPAFYANDNVYIPVVELFQILKINNKASQFNDTVSGFYLNETNKYNIIRPLYKVIVGKNTYDLEKDDIIYTDSYGLALKLSVYGKAFGLNCKFDFSSLSVELKTSLELPIIKELRLEQMRKNINKLLGEIHVDTTYKRKYHFLNGGMADWAIYSTQTIGKATETRGLLSLGGELLGGETNIQLNYSTKEAIDERQQQYKWRWVNNNTKLVKQITAGKLGQRSIASIYSPMIGFSATNTPSTYRRSFGSYTVSDYTEPGWQVELYINNVIVDYTTADASGFFTFNIPLVYGASTVLFKFYGPWGEERQKEQTINVPYYFLPKGSLEYTISGGIVQDKNHSYYSRSEVGYGINRSITIGGGYEYLSSIASNPGIPFASGSATFLSHFIVSSEYAYNVRSQTLLSFRLPSNFSIDIDYTNYAKEQKAIAYNYLEERRISMSIPINIHDFRAFGRLVFKQNLLKETSYSTAEANFSTYVHGFSTNITGYANWLSEGKPYIYSNLALGFRFFRSLSFRPQIQYDFTNNKLINIKAELENSFSQKLHLSFTWDNNVKYNSNTADFTLRYNFPFAQTSMNARLSKDNITTGQSMRGSLAIGSGNGYVHWSERGMVGKSGLTIIPFLDINNNNHKDKGEPIIDGMNIGINGGRILKETSDSLIRIIDLEPFAGYMLEFSDTQFENISWQIPDKVINVMIDPNQFKHIEVPIKVMGEINGYVFMQTGNKTKGQGRIIVNIFTQEGKFIHKCLTEPDGYFSYIGLLPGDYYACVDSTQLTWLNSVCKPEKFQFEIAPTTSGDIIENVEFKLTSLKVTITENTLTPTPKIEIEKEKATVKQNTNNNTAEPSKPIHIITPISKAPAETAIVITKPENTSNTNVDFKTTFFLQMGAFKTTTAANEQILKLKIKYPENWINVEQDNLFKVRIDGFETYNLAKRKAISLKLKNGSYYIGKNLK